MASIDGFGTPIALYHLNSLMLQLTLRESCVGALMLRPKLRWGLNAAAEVAVENCHVAGIWRQLLDPWRGSVVRSSWLALALALVRSVDRRC